MTSISATGNSITASKFPKNRMRFLGDDPWFPMGCVTILGGKKRSGKSTLALYECAKFSAMGKKVLIVQREDPVSLVVTRLDCMGADLDNIEIFCQRVQIDGECVNQVGFDAGDIKGIISRARFVHADLVYVDPLHALSTGRMNDQNSADCMDRLSTFAKQDGCCVLGVMHAHKRPRDIEYAISGSDQWVAKARSYLYLAQDPEDPTKAICDQGNASYSKKSNAEIKFGMAEVVDDDDGELFQVSVVEEVYPTTATAQDYLDIENSKRDDQTDPVFRSEITQWLHDTIHSEGNHALAVEIFKKAKRRGWNPPAVRKAMEQAGVRQAKEPARAPRSILYLTDAAEYTGESLKRINQGVTPETLAKEWCMTIPR